MSVPSTSIAAFIGRQPILDRQQSVYGYELLFRDGDVTTANIVHKETATAQVVLDSFLEFGLDALVGDRLAFINATRAFLIDGLSRQLPRDRVVVEVLEDVPPDAEVTAEVQALGSAGYRVALDDFVFEDARTMLLPYVSIVKLDISAFDHATLSACAERLRAYPVELVAERVETTEEFERCRALGCQYFQGFFFARPTTLLGRRVPVERLAALRVLTLLADDETPLPELVEAVAADVTLSFQVLRLINSAFFARATRVQSLRDGVMLLGRDRLRGWVTLMALSGIEARPAELLMLALVRAKMCETLGARLSVSSPATWFTAGLFSALDLFFEAPLPELLAALPLSPEVTAAVVDRSGHLGAVLDAVVAFERTDWGRVRCAQLDARDFMVSYGSAVQWADEWVRRGQLLTAQ